MTNNLEKAKEFKEKKRILNQEYESIKEKDNHSFCKGLPEVDGKRFKEIRKELIIIQKEAKDLKEKIENEGCGKRCFPQSNPDNLKCGTKWAKYIHYCPKCLKAIKICEEILQ